MPVFPFSLPSYQSLLTAAKRENHTSHKINQHNEISTELALCVIGFFIAIYMALYGVCYGMDVYL